MECIYYKNNNDGQGSREHIFPAFVGGIRKLPSDYVSQKANSFFSKMEIKEALYGDICVPKMFLGPGYRGTKTVGKLTIMTTRDIKDESWGLGYVFYGTPYPISHICIQGNLAKLTIGICKSREDGFKEAQQQLLSFSESSRFCFICDKKLPADCILIGTYKNSFYIASSKNKRPKNKTIIAKINDVFSKFDYKKSPIIHKSNRCTVNPQCHIDKNTDRFYGKICFNALAHLRGKEFVLKECFDDYREWLIAENNNTHHIISDKIASSVLKKMNIPNNAHWCMFIKINNVLYAFISLYGLRELCFMIGNLDKIDFPYPDGYICDWQNKREYSLIEYIKKLSDSEANHTIP